VKDTKHYNRGVFPCSVNIWLKQRFGMDGLNRILERLGSDARTMLEVPAPNTWYPASLLREVYSAINEEYSAGHPDIFTEYGHYNADRDVKGLLRYLMRFITMEKLLKRMQSFWKQYNRGATIEASPVTEKGSRKYLTVTVRNYDLGLPGCEALAEYIRVLCVNTGAKKFEIKKEKCIHKGADYCSWRINWEE